MQASGKLKVRRTNGPSTLRGTDQRPAAKVLGPTHVRRAFRTDRAWSTERVKILGKQMVLRSSERGRRDEDGYDDCREHGSRGRTHERRSWVAGLFYITEARSHGSRDDVKGPWEICNHSAKGSQPQPTAISSLVQRALRSCSERTTLKTVEEEYEVCWSAWRFCRQEVRIPTSQM